MQSLVADESFQHILRVLNTNVDGKQKIMFAMTAIRGIGRRFSNLACKKAEVDMRKRWASKDYRTWLMTCAYALACVLYTSESPVVSLATSCMPQKEADRLAEFRLLHAGLASCLQQSWSS